MVWEHQILTLPNYHRGLIEVHNEPSLNVDEQQSGTDDADEILEIKAARTPKKKELDCVCDM